MKTRIMNKKIMTIALMMFCLLMLMPASVNAKTTSKNWYKKVLKSTSGSYKIGSKKYKRSKYKYYKLIDINQDGTKELILSKGKRAFLGDGKSALLLVYNNKKIKAVKNFYHDGGCALGYNKKNKTLNFMGRDSGSTKYVSYQLKNGKLVTVEKTTYNREFLEDYPYYNYIYKINGTTTDESNWAAYSKKMYGSDISYKKIP